MKFTAILANVLVIIGAIVWLLIGLFAFDPVAWIFGAMSVVSRIIYTAVGLAGLFMIIYLCIYHPFDQISK